MAERYHIIQRHVFDIRYAEREKAYELQSRFSRLFDREGKAVLQEVADRVIPDSLLLRLEELDVDLGHIPEERLEKEFPIRLKEALEEALLRVIQEHSRRNKSGLTQSLAELLEHFLLTGSLPWWAAGTLLSDPVAVVEQLIKEDARALRQLLISVGQRDYVRRRLAYQFPDEVIRAMVTVLEPDEAVFIFGYYSDVVEVQKRESLFRQDSGEFRQSLWIFIFTYLLIDRGSNFNRKIFVRSTLAQMARRYNREYSGLITLLFRALEGGPSGMIRRGALSGIIEALYQEQGNEPENNEDVGAQGIEERLEMIRNFLVDSQPVHQDVRIFAETLLRLIAEAPAAVHDLLRSLSGQEGIWGRIVFAFDEEVVKELVRLREPEESEFIFHYARRLSNLQRQQPIVKTESSGFYLSVWELILTFVWTERGSLFNTRRFLEYHVRRLARRYHIAYRKLLEFLVQGIGQDIRSDRDSTLFHSLTVLLQENGTEAGDDKAAPVKDAGSASAAEWLEALDHYLIHRRWPERWKLEGGVTEAILLQQVLQWLFRERPLLLMKLLVEAAKRSHPPVDDVAMAMVRQTIRLLFGPTVLARHRVEHIILVGGKEPIDILIAFMGGEELPAIVEVRRDEMAREGEQMRGRQVRGRRHAGDEGQPSGEKHATDERRLKDERQPGGKKEARDERQPRDERREKDERQARDERPKDNLYIQNAGLILLHPLIPHFFGQLGLTQERKFVDDAAQGRSAHLLQFLVDGRGTVDGKSKVDGKGKVDGKNKADGKDKVERPEHQLILNKILCDIPIQDPVERSIVIREEEERLTTQLFQVLRERWPKMQNTTDEGIRVSFLQRDGILTAIEDGWRMQVEQKGIDVLLPFLPWGWGMVKLPWMKTTIYTEWT
ncbi:MAG TPA: contractile injection system tape measure protein [Puia sp.]|jgi:hypothetical protein|nr:contractile injection system tape measure protein [Puia sp.]